MPKVNDPTEAEKILKVCFYVAGFTAIASGAFLNGIEDTALRQPHVATGPFIYPHELKGAIYYFTQPQETFHSVLAVSCTIGVLLAFAFGAGWHVLRARRIKTEPPRPTDWGDV